MLSLRIIITFSLPCCLWACNIELKHFDFSDSHRVFKLKKSSRRKLQSSRSTIGSLGEWGEQPRPFCREECNVFFETFLLQPCTWFSWKNFLLVLGILGIKILADQTVLALSFSFIFVFLMKESCKWINGITKYCHKVASVAIFPFTYMKYYHNKVSGLVSFLLRFAAIRSFSQHLRCWRLFLLKLPSVFSWKYIWCSQDHNE